MDVFPLRRPPFWKRSLLVILIGLAVLVGLISASPEPGNLLTFLARTAVGFGTYLTLAGLLLAARLLRLPKKAPAIALNGEGLALPLKPDSRVLLTVPFADLKAVELRFSPPEGFLLIESKHRTFFYRARDFEDPEDILRFGATLKARLGEQEEGQAMLAGLATESIRMQAAITRPTHVTHGIAAVLGAVFVLQIFLDAIPELGGVPSHLVAMLRMGAGQSLLVRNGDSFRLITATYLHGGMIHFGFNLLGLFLVGGLVERVLGPWRFALTYGLAGLGGSLASMRVFTDHISVGASGCLFGLLGAYAVVSLRHHRALPGGFRISREAWAITFVINALLPKLFPGIDWAAHLGGLVTGALVALAVAFSARAVDPQIPTPGWIRVTTALVAALWFAGTAAGISAGLQGDLNAVAVAARSESTNFLDANALAWELCLDADAGRPHLRAARDLAKAAVERSKQLPMIRDTLAQCLHRLGEAEAATEIELEVVEATLGSPDAAVFVTQLARFQRPLEAPEEALIEGITLVSRGGGVEVSAPAHEDTRLLWFSVSEEGKPVGFLRLCLGPDAVDQKLRMPVGVPRPVAGAPGWPKQASFEARILREGACSPPASGWSLRFWAPDPDAVRFP